MNGSGALVDEKFRSRDLALAVSFQSMDKRLDSMNGFLEALRDQSASYVTRPEYQTAHEILARVIDTIRLESSRYAVRVDELDRAGVNERAQLDKRLDGMNEFRAQLKDQASTFLARNEYILAHESLVSLADQTRVDLSRHAARVDEFDRSSTVARAQLEKYIDSLNEIRVQLKDQSGWFATRGEVTVQNTATAAEIKRLEASVSGAVRKEEHDQIEARTLVIENKLSNWEGRLWALGAVFLLINVVVSWYLSGRLGH
jgi:hypothetical protein